ncbi:Heat shock protein DnaJ with tetratricopeptide repeat [Heracleum sosnowskyi]|uniref:Heat shock protein DnaJ with tetratricopeptide repeat n=1 Tax=Heracleum sosnowskyi TaxID=360622 RepID=A0AAD8HET5_9APIA|nr:Heat shock protein DnaJ with tetratricopeptide repeat [Heracleum sosnowskyi]
MSPSVTHIQSPISTQNESQSTLPRFPPNPNPNFNKPPNFSSLASSLGDYTTFNSSSIGKTSDRASNSSFCSVFESRVSSNESNVAANSSGRSKPRLVKVRRHGGSQYARSKFVKENIIRGNDVCNDFSKVSNLNSYTNQFGNTVNFVIGGNKSNVVPDTKLFNGQSGGSLGGNGAGKVGSLDGLGKSSNFVFGSDGNVAILSSNSNLEAKEAVKNKGRYVGERKNGEEGTKSEFVFGTTDRASLSKSNLEKKGAGPTSFVFDSGNLKSASDRGNNGKGFVFGASISDSAGTADAGAAKSWRKANRFSSLRNGKTEHCNSKVKSSFVFGSGCKESFHLSSGSQHGNDTENLNFKKTEKCNAELKGKDNNTDYASKSMPNFVFESRGKDKNTNSAFKDEMQKMNIHDSKIVDGADTFKSSSVGSFSNLTDKFVFSSDKKTSVSFTENSTFTSLQDGQINNINAANDKSCEEKVFGLGNSEKNVPSFGDSVENQIPDTLRSKDSRYGIGLFSGQNIPSFSSFGTRGKENKSLNSKENGMDGKQNLGYQTSLNNGVGGSFYSSSSSSMGFGYQPFDSVYEAPSADQTKEDKEFRFTSTPVQHNPSFTGFSTPNLKMPANLFSDNEALKKDKDFTSTNTEVQPGPPITGFTTPDMNMPANLFSGISMKLDFSVNNVSAGGRRLKKTRGKLKHKVSKYINFQQNEAPLDCGSPMDFSPYQEASCAEAFHSNISSGTANEGLAAARDGSGEREGDVEWSKENEKGLKDYHGTEPLINSKTGIAAETRASLSSIEKGECDANSQYCAASTSQSHGDTRFAFPASSSAQNDMPASTRRSMKKYRMKIGHGSDSTVRSWKSEFTSSYAKSAVLGNSSIETDGFQAQRAGISNTQRNGVNRQSKNEKSTTRDLNEAATIEACEKWRISGNQAYRRGSLPKAENYYTKCISAITQMKTPECCIEPLVLCYSNRAATQLCLGRIREALRDCNSAASLDSNFQKVQMRAANCHLLLGEVEDAMLHFNKCLESSADFCLDRRIMIEAADGVQKVQKVIDCASQSAELLEQRTSDAATKALRIIMEALTISSHSEKLLELKGEALCMLRKYEEVVHLCEQTLGFAEKNFTSIDTANQLSNADSCNGSNSDIKSWRWRLMSKSYFHMGRLEASLELIKKQEDLRSIDPKYRSEETDWSVTLAATVRELLDLKNAGNKAFQCGEHAEAIEHYTAVISSSVQSRPFTAVCFCNRAAAHQALGRISDAIADCSLAISLNENYGKALFRRATLHEMIRDYEQAASDLQRIINLQKQSKELNQESDTPLGTGGIRDYTKEARSRLSSVERKAKKGAPLDFYLLLGIKSSDTTSDIKKAYHRAALKHHPDKAGQFLVRTESLDEGPLRKEIAEKIHVDADRLFKMIGEAYAVLSDSKERSKYDLEEEIRKENDKNNSSRRESHVYNSPFERSNRDYGRGWGMYGESWKTHGKSHSRW